MPICCEQHRKIKERIMSTIEIHHINATHEDFLGNDGIGRYLFLTGSDERARELSAYFSDVELRPHPRQHNLYLGTITNEHHDKIDVGAISTGMGGPSADIIINELIMLGARRLLRIGTAGSMQPDKIRVGSLVIATGAVRDDKASWDYIYKEYPALASMEFLIAVHRARDKNAFNFPVHFGIVHSKSSLYAREYNYSLLEENHSYMRTLRQAGVLASEMECAQLFILSSLMSRHLPQDQAILSGGILAIIGDDTSFTDNKDDISLTINNALQLGLCTVRELYRIDRKQAQRY